MKVDSEMVKMDVGGEEHDAEEGGSLVPQHDSGDDSEEEGGVGQVKEITQMEYIKDAICLLIASCTMLLANKAAVRTLARTSCITAT